MHKLLKTILTLLAFICCFASKTNAQQPYNVLLITIDDLNDWVGYLGGNAQSITPNIDKLASQSLIFNNAQCPSSLCNPSRVSFLTGYLPATSKLYSNGLGFRSNPVTQNAITLPEYFKQKGYYTMNVGKVFHDTTGYMSDPQSWDLIGLPGGSWDSVATLPGYTPNGIPINQVQELFWWAAQPDSAFNKSADYKSTQWVKSQLNTTQAKPFFLGCGFDSPHLEWNVPQLFLNKFPLSSIVLPPVDTNDLADIGGGIQPTGEYYATRDYGLQKEAVRAYLGAIAYMDSCVGIVLDALEKSAYANNTIVVLLGDNGYHMGEKLRYLKFTLWEESARVPLLIKVPGAPSAGARVNTPVSLNDIYPTLTQLCNLPPNTNVEGEDLSPFFTNPQMVSNRSALTTIKIGKDKILSGSTIRTKDWRYILHLNNEQELYNHVNDTMEFVNLANNVLYDSIRLSLAAEMDKQLDKKSTLRLPIRKNTIPGEFQAEKYDMGGEGKGYHDIDTINFGAYYRLKDGVDIKPCADAGGGLQVDSISNGEWLGYTVSTVDSGTYTVRFRVSSNTSTAKKIKVSLNGVLLTKKSIGNTADAWQTISSSNFILTKKTNAKLKIVFSGTGYRLNSFEFVKSNAVLRSTDLISENKLQIEIQPNPVAETTQLSFELLQSGMVDLHLTNLLGERVCSIVRSELDAGKKSISFNPLNYNLTPGIYLCTLDINNHQYSVSKKLVIVK